MPIPAAILGPLILGGLSAVGGIGAGLLNRRSAADQMRFQERMSNSAAQRAAADFRAAGMNPALAYGHQASSPAGAMTHVQDPITPAVSNAQSAKIANAQLQLAREEQNNRNVQSGADWQIKNQQMGLLAHQQTSAAMDAAMKTRENVVQQQILPQTMQQRVAQALIAVAENDRMRASARLESLKIPGAENEAALQQLMGTWGAALPLISSGVGAAAPIFRMLQGLGRAGAKAPIAAPLAPLAKPSSKLFTPPPIGRMRK